MGNLVAFARNDVYSVTELRRINATEKEILYYDVSIWKIRKVFANRGSSKMFAVVATGKWENLPLIAISSVIGLLYAKVVIKHVRSFVRILKIWFARRPRVYLSLVVTCTE